MKEIPDSEFRQQDAKEFIKDYKKPLPVEVKSRLIEKLEASRTKNKAQEAPSPGSNQREDREPER